MEWQGNKFKRSTKEGLTFELLWHLIYLFKLKDK